MEKESKNRLGLNINMLIEDDIRRRGRAGCKARGAGLNPLL